MLLRPDERTDEEKRVVEVLRRLSHEVAQAQELALDFVALVKARRADDLRGWLIEGGRGVEAEFASFATGVTADLRPARAALEYEWGNGRGEGQLKLIKRQMYGRGEPGLLLARVLCPA